jgi:SAM-dependent methyltransferase
MSKTPQTLISEACEEDLLKYGDNFRGVGYTKSEYEASERYALMLEVIRERGAEISLLDLGCGLGHLLDFIQRHTAYQNVRYTGLDLSRRYIDAARKRHPETAFVLMDVLGSDAELGTYDYIILNGLFNYRGSISWDEMLLYWQRLTAVCYAHCTRGIVFNVMSKLVDWERDDLFHLPFDSLAAFVGKHLSRHFIIRHDYRAYEYTTYVYRSPYALDVSESSA